MTGAFGYKVYIALGIVISLGLASSAENDIQDRSKYKYGYVISHKGGSTQAHLESRDGNLALGRYYVNLRNGTGQKVTYFADDLGFHTGVSYSSQNGRGSSKTQIAMGQRAVAAFGDSEPDATATVASPTLLFGSKLLKAVNAVTPKPTSLPKLNYTPVPGGFYLTHEPLDGVKVTTEHPSYVAGLTSQAFSSGDEKQSVVTATQSNINAQTFFGPSSENVKNEINQLHIQFTTPSIKSYTAVPQQVSLFSRTPEETFSQKDQNVKVSTYATNFNDLSYSREKSVEKNNFADIDAQIISEVQKHAEQIIMKDLRKSQNVNLQDDFARFTVSGTYQPSTVTMQPIVVTNNGEIGLNAIISTTAIPDISKASKNLQFDTINSVKISEKNPDQALQDSGYFRVSLSPSLASSINVSQTPHQSINVDSTDRNSVSNNSTLCEFNLCQKDTQQIFSIDLNTEKPENKAVQDSGASASDITDSSGTSKVVQTFYPENKLHDEEHYITTIDVQKAISLDVNQNEAGSIQLAQNFPFNKIKSFDQVQNPTPQPIISNQISVTPNYYSPEPNLNVVSPPQKPYILNSVTTAPGLFDVTPNQNLAVLQGLNDVTSGQGQYGPVVEDRIGNNRLGYESQLVVPPPPVVLTNEAAEDYRQKQEDLQQVQKSIQELRQQILSDIDAQHEEEQRKQNLVDEERKQYFENLKKVEELKNQNSYNAAVNSQANIIQATASPVSSVENANNVELLPEAQFLTAPQPQYQQQTQIQYDSEPQTQYHPTSQVQFNSESQTQYESAPQTQFQSAPQTQFQSAPQTQFQSAPQTQFQSAPQTQFQSAPQTQFQSEPQTQYQPAPQPQYESAAQTQYQPPPQPQYETVPQTQYEPAPQQQYVQPQTFQTEIKDFTHEVAVPQPAIQSTIQQVPNLDVYQQKPVLTNNQNNRDYSLYENQNLFAVDNNIQQSAPVYTTEKIQLNNYVPQIAPIAFQPRYAVPQTAAQVEEKPKNVQQLALLNTQLNTVPVNLATEVVPSAKLPESKGLLVNRVVPFDYTRLFNVKQTLPLFQTYQLPLPTDSKLTIPDIYSQQLSLPVQLPQTYKFLPYPNVPPTSTKQYHSTLTQKQTNRVRVQPLKPSTPDEDSQREAVQNLLSRPEFNPTYYYAGLPINNNRLQLRHIRKNQIGNADQVRSQSVIRRGKSLKNLRIEYGFKPPLRPSVEFSEEVKPSIYGPSVKPQ